MVRTRGQRAAAVPAQETTASTSRRRTKPSDNSGRGRGGTKKVTLTMVSAAFDKLVADKVNKPDSAKKKLGIVRSVSRHFLRSKNRASEDINRFDLRELFRPGADAFVQFMERIYPNASTRATNMSAFVSLMDVIGSKTLGVSASGYDTIYTNGMARAAEVRDATRNEQPAQQGDVATWEECQAVERKLRETELGSQKHLVAALYTLIPPRRSEYCSLRFTTVVKPETPENNEKNWVVVPTDADQPCSLDIRSYKTERAFGRFLIKLDEASEYAKFFTDIDVLNQAIRRYCAGKANGALLFPDGNGEVNTPKFLDIVKSTFLDGTKKHIGVRALRHIYSTWIAMGPPLSVSDQQRVSFLMAHSWSTNQGYREFGQVLQDYEERQEELADLRGRTREQEEETFTLGADRERLIAALEKIAELSRSMTSVIEGVLADS